jgi:hypothetical protein
VKIVYSDGNGEFSSKQLNKDLKSVDIIHTSNTSYTPQYNSVTERKIKSIVSMARCMLINSGLFKKFWPEVVRYATMVENQFFTKSVEDMTPFEKYNSVKPDLKNFRVFGYMFGS